MAQEKQSVVVVAGDVTMDWHIARAQRAQGGSVWSTESYARINWQRGGAALLADLIAAVAGDGAIVRSVAAPQEPVQPGDPRFHHVYTLWSPFKYGEKPPHDKEKPAWRMAEFLGVDRVSVKDAAEPLRVTDDSPEADLVVLDDADLGFRDRPDLWPAALTTAGARPGVLLQMRQPVAQGALWDHLHQHHAARLIVVMTVDDLRRTEVQISRELSWERTAQDLAWELVHNPRVNALAHCAHVVISFGPAGAVLLSRSGPSAAPECWLFFDPPVIEGMWEQSHPGGMIGYTTCLTASLARQMLLAPDQPNIHQSLQVGLTALRTLHREGYGERGAAVEPVQLAFPIRRIAAELGQTAAPFAAAPVQDPLRFLAQPAPAGENPPEAGFWTILHDHYQGTLSQVAERIVRAGPEAALPGVPLGRFGNLLTVDRQEIESFRSIRTLVGEYCQGQQKRPLSIAVFGAPGSGKSFGIVEVASSLLPGQIEVREFNLSQLGDVDDLLAALHQVRDVGLSGKIPLIFWDEFDTALAGKPLGWLRYFLAPMQDGRFQEGQISHPIGRAIFVFAGGTSERMDTFGQGLTPAEFRAAKGPDFVSRLKGYVNILGPNPAAGRDDPYYIIRRAILLRSLLQRHAPQLFVKQDVRIDRGVLHAFLETRVYKHGVRSMESILAMSQLAGQTSLERSRLPAEAQLDLHVDGRDFLALVQRPDLDGELLEKLAMAAHEVFCEGLQARQYHWGPQTDDQLKTHLALVPYADLSAELQEQNRANVRDIPAKLAAAGYVMLPARSNEPPFDFPGDDLERLAEQEHERWIATKQAAGWRPGPALDPAQKLHPSLVPWAELPKTEQEKDRDLVRGIPRILARAGYAVLRSRAAAREA